MYKQYQEREPTDRTTSSPANGLPSPPESLPLPSVPLCDGPEPAAAVAPAIGHPNPASPFPRPRHSAADVPVDGSSSPCSDSLSSVTIQNVSGGGDREEEEFVGEECESADGNGGEGQEARNALLAPMQLARAHWIQLHKTNMQLPVLRHMFVRLLQQHPKLRAVWPFARVFDGTVAALKQLTQSNAFFHYCQIYQAAITMLMDNLDDESALWRQFQEFGSNHFFYDCAESDLPMIRTSFVHCLVEYLAGTNEALDEQLTEDWNKFWDKLEFGMRSGLRIQRYNYLVHCAIGTEIEQLRAEWYQLVAHYAGGVEHLAKKIASSAVEPFLDSLAAIGMIEGEGSDGNSRNQFGLLFSRSSRELLSAMEAAIVLWKSDTGFLHLCGEINSKKRMFVRELFQRVGTPLIRQAFIEAFARELAAASGVGNNIGANEKNPGDRSMLGLHSWTKVYRIAEQAVIMSDIA